MQFPTCSLCQSVFPHLWLENLHLTTWFDKIETDNSMLEELMAILPFKLTS